MKTIQDLMQLTADADKARFCYDAVKEYKTTRAYREATSGEAYYNKHNLTIEAYQKTLTTLSGGRKVDLWSANYKLKTLFFRRLISQQVQYVLGNGLVLSDTTNKEKLGRNFDFQLVTAAKEAMACGVAYGFWNVDHLEVFSAIDTPTHPGFCPVYNEKTGLIDAGIRYWFRKVNDEEIFRATLYEEDGYTEFIREGNTYSVIKPKSAYVHNIKNLPNGEIESITDMNYSKLPIVALFANDTHESELVGIRECIDCYDFIKSGLANNIDDSSEIYWILKNTGGMDDVDLAQFMYRMKTVKGAVIDGDQNADVQPHTIEIPVEARRAMLEILRADIYEDFQSLDVRELSAAAKTTQEIQAAYQSQDNKCADFEYFVLDFVQQILELAGIDDDASFVWNKILNQPEQTSMILSAAPYLTDEAIVKHLPFLTPEEADDVLNARDKADYNRFDEADEEEPNETEEGENGANKAPQGDEE